MMRPADFGEQPDWITLMGEVIRHLERIADELQLLRLHLAETPMNRRTE